MGMHTLGSYFPSIFEQKGVLSQRSYYEFEKSPLILIFLNALLQTSVP
jgi:maltodextrin utilization protein YvdJ